jgi:cobalt-precorrin-5B (C1)-methyltransferase
VSKNKQLRNGYTTGSCVAAGAVAAANLLWHGQQLAMVTVYNLEGIKIEVPIQEVSLKGDGAKAIVIKDGGDDPDVTHGIEFIIEVKALNNANEIKLIGGHGVGKVTKPGLQVPVGQWAINPNPRKIIINNLATVLPKGEGAEVTITIPQGEEIAKRTLNGKLGIVGGISILGTTGIVRPMSEEAFKDSLIPQIKVAKAHGFNTIILTPGRIGEKIAQEKFGVPEDAIVQMSNFVGFMLNACVDNGIKEVILLGHHSKLVKVAAGCFYTHSKVCDARLETIAAYAAMAGAKTNIIKEIMASITAEGVVPLLETHDLLHIFDRLAAQATHRAQDHVFGDLKVGTVMVTMDGEIIGKDENAAQIGRDQGWLI